MTDDWKAYVTTWCALNGLAAESAVPWLMQQPSGQKARRQKQIGASDRVLDGLLHKAAIEAELIKGT